MADSNGGVNSDLGLVRISGNIGGITDWEDITTKEVIIGESQKTGFRQK